MSDRIFYIYILNYMNVFSTALWHKRYLSTHTYAHTGCITPLKAASMRITKSRKVPILANLQHTCMHAYIHTYILSYSSCYCHWWVAQSNDSGSLSRRLSSRSPIAIYVLFPRYSILFYFRTYVRTLCMYEFHDKNFGLD